MTQKLFQAVAALKKNAQRIRRLEAQAREALFVEDDPAAYREKLKEKTMLLMELPELIGPFCQDLDKEAARQIDKGLESFAMRAQRAMELSSVFYMNALLYPEDYREGDPNDLEVFIKRLETLHLT
ncbi:MAG: hypothetical protein ACP5IL_13085 [Syntrophobacteraceae bacterium]